jgi:hypothetical protein
MVHRSDNAKKGKFRITTDEHKIHTTNLMASENRQAVILPLMNQKKILFHPQDQINELKKLWP